MEPSAPYQNQKTKRYLRVTNVRPPSNNHEVPTKEDDWIASGLGLLCLVCAIILLTVIVAFVRTYLKYA